FTAAVAGGLLLAEDSVLLGPELSGATALGGSARATNLEALLGIHLRGEQLAFGVGAGPGLSLGTGTPDLRIVASAGYAGGSTPASEPSRVWSWPSSGPTPSATGWSPAASSRPGWLHAPMAGPARRPATTPRRDGPATAASSSASSLHPPKPRARRRRESHRL